MLESRIGDNYEKDNVTTFRHSSLKAVLDYWIETGHDLEFVYILEKNENQIDPATGDPWLVSEKTAQEWLDESEINTPIPHLRICG